MLIIWFDLLCFLVLYAIPMIMGELRRHLRDSGSVRVSRSMRDTAYHAMKAKEELTVKLNREPTVEEIAFKEALKKLSEREKRILSLRYFKGKTQTEVAEEIGISQAQVSRIEKGAIDSIKREL